MNLTTGKVHDAALAQTTIEKLPAANITVVMDRGYNDYSLFAWLSKRGTTFVTRLKDNAVTTPLKKGCRSEGDNYGDYQFEFDSPAGREACGELQFRVVQWHDTDNDRWFNFLTNDMDLKPEQIAALLADEERRLQMAEHGREKTAREHTWDGRAVQFLQILRERR